MKTHFHKCADRRISLNWNGKLHKYLYKFYRDIFLATPFSPIVRATTNKTEGYKILPATPFATPLF
jgi:hypothetical protein